MKRLLIAAALIWTAQTSSAYHMPTDSLSGAQKQQLLIMYSNLDNRETNGYESRGGHSEAGSCAALH